MGVASLLLSRGSNIDVMNVRGHKVIDMAVRYGYVAVTELLHYLYSNAETSLKTE